MSPYRVLVVEDDFATRELITEILEQNGYQVVSKTDGVSALKAVEEGKYDLALVDVMLPNLNGFQICERIRDDPRNEMMPVIMLTVLTESQHRIRALQAGATSFLSKPFDRLELLTQIHSLINLTHKVAQRERFDDIVFCFLTMLGIRSPEIVAHSQRVASLSEQVACRLGLSLSMTEEVKTGALLHDVGKLCHDILPSDPASVAHDDLAWLQHTASGDRMFSRFHRPLIRSIIRFHHDECSGAESLEAIRDPQVKLAIQIVAVCNRFDNLLKAQGQNTDDAENRAIEMLHDEVERNCWNAEVYCKLLEITKTFGSGLFEVLAPEYCDK